MSDNVQVRCVPFLIAFFSFFLVSRAMMESEDFSEYHNRKTQYRLNLAWEGCSWFGMGRGWRGGCSCQQPQPWSATFFSFKLVFFICLIKTRSHKFSLTGEKWIIMIWWKYVSDRPDLITP